MPPKVAIISTRLRPAAFPQAYDSAWYYPSRVDGKPVPGRLAERLNAPVLKT
jgi:hypothetical protein